MLQLDFLSHLFRSKSKPEAAAPRSASASRPSAAMPPAPDDFGGMCQGPFAHIAVRFNPRLSSSWRIEWMRGRTEVTLVLPELLRFAPAEVKTALLEWACLARRRKSSRNPEDRIKRTEREERVRAYLEADPASQAPQAPEWKRKQSLLLRRRRQRRIHRLQPRGRHHDLERIFDQVNRDYFQGELEARLTWSGRIGGLSTHTVLTDPDGKPYHLISISRGYDFADIPERIVGGVVYHESLHIVIPPRMEGGRRVVHGSDFRRREKQYRHYAEWVRWHREELPRKIAALQREARRAAMRTAA